MGFDPTTIAAWWGAASGTGVLIWDVVKWYKTSARLVVSANGRRKLFPSVPGQQPGEYVLVSISNRGRASTTITGIAAFCFKGAWLRLRKQSEHAFILQVQTQQPLPFKIGPGEQWSCFFQENDVIRRFGESGVVELLVSVSHRDKPIRHRVDFSV